MQKLDWEQNEEFEDGTEYWTVGIKKKDIWYDMFDVCIDHKKKTSDIEFEVFSFPRHIVEDSGWKTLKDAIGDLKKSIKEMERIDAVAKKLDIKIISDEFIGFKTNTKVETIDHKEIEYKILELKKSFAF